MRTLVLVVSALCLVSCGSKAPEQAPKQTEAAAAREPAVKPADESRRFPQVNLVGTQVVESALLGKKFMPGGTLARYKKGNTEYQMFLARAASATDAGIKVGDWRAALTNPEFVASFGGYFGQDAGVPVFVFAKGDWIAGIVGLPRKDADAAARTFAARL